MDGVRHIGGVMERPSGRLTQQTFTTKVLPAFGLGLLMTAAGAFLGQGMNPVFYLPIVLVEFLLVLTSGLWQRKDGLNQVLFFVYALCSGLTLVPLLHWASVGAGVGVIVQALVVTTVTFAGCAAFGLTTKRDISGLGGFLLATCLGLIVASIMGIFFFHSTIFMMGLTVLGVALFSAFTAYDMNRIRNDYLDADWMGAALALYIDFIGLFTYILRFFGFFGSNRDD
jgi:FtsH-binding integral membrane protein